MAMATADASTEAIGDDERRLEAMGYSQELARRLGAFSNFAISLSIICILAGGVTSFHLGLCSVGGASIGLGWPLVAAFAMVVAATMGQLASTFPTAGGLYHWSSILGGRGWGWATAWFNLAGLVTVLAAINVGTYRFAMGAFGPSTIPPAWELGWQVLGLLAITGSQAAINHLGISVTARLTDFSGYWILLISALLTVSLLAFAPGLDPSRLVTFSNYSGPAGADTWPLTSNLAFLFALGALLPAYTITGFDASAHASEETIGAAESVPRGILRSVLVSGVAGWILLAAAVMAAPSLADAAARGEGAFLHIVGGVLPGPLAWVLVVGIALAQYLCGLATVTSASRMTFAFARDGGLPFSRALRRVSPTRRSPSVAIWTVAVAAVLFTVYTPVYSTITAVCTILLYISYVLPTALGAWAHGRTWTTMGPWDLGRWYRPLAITSLLGCGTLIVIGMQPPNERSIWVVGGMALLLAVAWFGFERRRFPGPPNVPPSGGRPNPSPLPNQPAGPPPANLEPAPPAHPGASPSAQPDAPDQTPIAPTIPSATESEPESEIEAFARSRTPARIFVGRAGGSYRTETLLALRRDHAWARDAVRQELDLEVDLGAGFVASWGLFEVMTRAATKDAYLLRPDLGRQLDDASRGAIASRCARGADLQVVIGDGLSAAAVRAQVPALLPRLAEEAARHGWRFGQPFFVRHCRVGVLNDVGESLDPAVVVLLIGERPGLATAESLSAYMAFRPRTGHDDARRNLISNIHARGVAPAAAARRIADLASQMLRLQTSGVSLKEQIGTVPAGNPPPAPLQ
jgi:ethanolamine ammonia-lyase small subunit/amino acid transporter